ncbi:hypothetical protein A374_00874 [Fictibacillus macauensis ZFHKF-1]|uniref:HPr domain-containing protein n=1 Tax=Fictibacillus macauensis ZFHKF-1 TaxID=1196324 RepID=I8ANC2_9BACL|nr:HPr family phosphocarrier protein [Fictibacillus macauensis]EIT87289.1 hypothetical protein A374_00874 [Fictibacillus macauensis ZFHKF-1]
MKTICSKSISLTQGASTFTIQKMTDLAHSLQAFQSNVFLCKNGITLQAKKLSGLVSFFLTLRKGESFLLITEGADAQPAIDQVMKYFSLPQATV